ncbi:MAG: hypothetical protein GY753_11375 [Gammaproteobacteria bacterium]|nr:hypothetical protein [Gammaproteobacteria bacterium]
MTKAVDTQSQARSLLPLWLLILVFCLPVVIGWFLYLNPQLLAGSQQVNGRLIEPPRSISQVRLLRADGSNLKMRDMQGQWVLMLVVAEGCGDPCRGSLLELRKIERALGRDQARLQRLLLLGKPAAEQRQEIQNNRLQDTATVTAFEPVAGRPFLAQASTIFVVDPIGRLMLRYSSDTQSDKILSDIKRLMTATKNWNRGCTVCPAIN